MDQDGEGDVDGDEGDGVHDGNDNYHRSSRMDEDPSPGNITNVTTTTTTTATTTTNALLVAYYY